MFYEMSFVEAEGHPRTLQRATIQLDCMKDSFQRTELGCKHALWLELQPSKAVAGGIIPQAALKDFNPWPPAQCIILTLCIGQKLDNQLQ